MCGLAGGVAGWLLTLAGLWLVPQPPAAYADLAHLDLSMFLAMFALAAAVSLLAGMLPALRASRVAPGLQTKTLGEIGRSHVYTPVTNAQLVCRLMFPHTILKRTSNK